jgi:hypothetical protein
LGPVFVLDPPFVLGPAPFAGGSLCSWRPPRASAPRLFAAVTDAFFDRRSFSFTR